MKRTPILIAAAIAVLFVSCNSANTGLPVPKDAMMVLHISTSSLSSKLSWDEIKSSSWFEESASKENRDSLEQKLFENPEASGIDMKSDFILFVDKKGANNYIVFEGNLKDAAAFEKLIKEKNENQAIEKNGAYNFLKTGKSDLLCWTQSKFMVLGDLSNRTSAYTSYDSEEQDPFNADSLKQTAKYIFSLKKSDDLASDQRFSDLFKETGDVHFWMNFEKYMSELPAMMDQNPMLAMMQSMNKFFKGNISTGTLNFDNGRIAVRSKQYLGGEMKKIMDKYEFKPVNEDLLKRIPSQNVIGAVAVNYPPEITKEIIQASGLQALADAFLSKYNYSINELLQGFGGQIVLALSDFSIKHVQKTVPGTTISYSATEPNIDMVLGVSVRNKASVDKLIGIAEGQLDENEKVMMQSKIHYKTSNDWFAVGSSDEYVAKLLAGGNAKIPFADKMTGHPIAMYVDIQKLIKQIQSQSRTQPESMTETADTWQDFVLTGGDYKNGVSTAEYTINLVDKSTNSLKQLNQYIEKLYEADKKKRAAVMNYTLPEAEDTEVATPPVQELPGDN